MTTVKFADLCDHPGCSKRSAEYAHWPVCRWCLHSVCPEHRVPGSVHGEDTITTWCVCVACQEKEEAL